MNNSTGIANLNASLKSAGLLTLPEAEDFLRQLALALEDIAIAVACLDDPPDPLGDAADTLEALYARLQARIDREGVA